MEILKTPMVKFYRHCLRVAKKEGYKWVFCLLARDADMDGIYDNLKLTWDSLDSITGKDFLFVVAGNNEYRNKFNEVVKIIEKDDSVKGVISCFINSASQIQRYQTYAVNDLKKYLSISENEIPCLVITSLCSKYKYSVNIHKNDIYDYIHDLVVAIEYNSNYLQQLEMNGEFDSVTDFLCDVIKSVDNKLNDTLNGRNHKDGDVIIRNLNYISNSQNSSIHIDQREFSQNQQLIDLISELQRDRFCSISARENEKLKMILSEIKDELHQANINKRKTSNLFNKLKTGTEIGAALATIFQAIAPSVLG